MGEDLNPQMRALDSTVDAATQDHVDRSIKSLLQAAQAVHDKTAASESTADLDQAPKALSLLADTALTEQMQTHVPPHLRSHGAVLPTPSQGPPPSVAHGPTDPRSFILPRPSPILSQPRHLLPGRGQLGLPDPFAMNGPPQLPPPPGSNFRSLPLPSYQFPGPPPPPGPPGPPGPSSLYFPSPHGHGHGPGPPPRRY